MLDVEPRQHSLTGQQQDGMLTRKALPGTMVYTEQHKGKAIPSTWTEGQPGVTELLRSSTGDTCHRTSKRASDEIWLYIEL